MNPNEETEYYRDVLEQGLQIISNALGVETEHYDRDQADGECYLDCFRDAAAGLDQITALKAICRDLYARDDGQAWSEAEAYFERMGWEIRLPSDIETSNGNRCDKCDSCGGQETYANQVCMPLNGKVRCIDWCIHQIVAALNAGGVETVACCCGHEVQPGRIDLADGRALMITTPPAQRAE